MTDIKLIERILRETNFDFRWANGNYDPGKKIR